jgi:hydroxymethylglutaryl-CoA reductase
MLEKPSAQELMQFVAVAGLEISPHCASTTTRIQDGHMKMHLNILNQFDATAEGRITMKSF